MSDYNERACANCGSYLHHENDCTKAKLPVIISSELEDDFNDEDEFTPCSQCDGHDACFDFGCAFEAGLGHMVAKQY